MHPRDFNRQLVESDWFNNLRPANGFACVHEWTTVGPGNVPHRALACTKCGKHRDYLNPANSENHEVLKS